MEITKPLKEFLYKDLVFLSFMPDSKESALKDLVNEVLKRGYITSSEEFYRSLLEREDYESTGLGNGVAIPHARGNSVKKLFVAFAYVPPGISFKSLDGKPVYAIFLIGAPPGKEKEYLILLSEISRVARKKNFLSELKNIKTRSDLLNILG